MSILKPLKLTAATNNLTLTPEHVLRGKLVSYLNALKALAEAEIGGTAFTATKRVTRTNEAGGKVRVDAPRHVRKGWVTDAQSKMFFQIRYGSKLLELAKGMDAVEVEKLADLPSLIASIIEAINAVNWTRRLRRQLPTARSSERPSRLLPDAIASIGRAACPP